MKKQVNGHATAICTIGPMGELLNCELVVEEPVGCGFGGALQHMASEMIASPKGKKDSPIFGREYIFDMFFQYPGGPKNTSC